MNGKKVARNSLFGLLCAGMLATGSCNSVKNAWNGMSQSGQGAAAGGTIGAAVGTGVGALIGGGKGTWIGALVGGALGAGTGALIGNSMDRQKKALEEQLGELKAQQDKNTAAIDKNSKDIEDIKVEMVKDRNNLDAIKLVMGDAVLFPTGKYQLSPAADATLSRIAYNLKQFPESDITVVGYTDNTGSQQINDKLSQQRAESVVDYLEQQGVAADRLKAIGKGWDDPIASNSTAAGRAQNRRVEIYITANQQAIANAEKQSGGN